MKETTKKAPSFGYAALTVVLAFGVIMFPAVFLGARTQPLFLIAWLISIPMCMRLGYTYKELQTGMFQFMARCLTPMTIVLCVGAMIGMWNASGTVASITRICLATINPQFFLVMAFFICLIFSLFTGTSFGTAGTAGVALMGVALSMGIDPLVAAPAIFAGAFFGDAFSPLSDSTNVAAGSADVDLLTSIKYQATVTIPSILICAVLFFVQGLSLDTAGADVSSIGEVITSIEANFKLGILPFIPLIVVLGMLLMKVPSIPSILSGAISGFLIAWLYQGHTFKETVSYMWSGFVMNSDNAFINQIFSRGGITSMSGTAFMFIFAFGLFGLLSTVGIIDKIVEPLTKRMTNRLSATLATVVLGLIANITSASGNFSFIFVGNLLRPVYEQNGLNKYDLTRAMTVGCLLCGLLIPWNSNPLTVAGFLNVDVYDVIPRMFILFVSLAVLIVVTVTNIDKKFSKIARGELPLTDGKE